MGLKIASRVFLPLSLFFFGWVKDERLPAMMESISVESLRRHVLNLHFARSPCDQDHSLERAAQYIFNELQQGGMDVHRDPFYWEGKRFDNIVAEKKGTSCPDRIILLGAHYDTVPGSPGADDNASAIAVLLEVAKHLKNTHLRSTLRLIAFSLEECGYIGSTHYAQKTKRESETLVGMISLEMVGFTGPRQNYPPYIDRKHYPPVGDFIAVVGNRRSEVLLENVRQAVTFHVPRLPAEFLMVPQNGEGMEEVRLSDHSPFWDLGYPALMMTDTAFLRNPNYHLPTDTIDTLDFEFMQKVAVGIVHAMVELAK